MVHLVEQCSANGVAMVSNPFEVLKFLFWVNLQVVALITITTATIISSFQ